MAEPVEDDVSVLEISERRPTVTPNPAPQPVQRKHISSRSSSVTGGASGGLVTDKVGLSASPLESPRTPDRSPSYNIDTSGSTYALQVALKNMKERYQKLQKKMALIEDENHKLLNGKSELFGEIGKLQENSIKLREKNLQLNQEIHSKHQECCSLREKFSSISQENMNLTMQLSRTTQENRRLNRQVTQLEGENKRLKEKLTLISQQVKALPDMAGLVADIPEAQSKLRTKIYPLSNDLESMDEVTSRVMSSLKDTLEDFEEITSSEIDGVSGPTSKESVVESNESLLSSVRTTTKRMKDLYNRLQDQNQKLLLLSPLMSSTSSNGSTQTSLGKNAEGACVSKSKSHTRTLSQRDRDISSMTVSQGHPKTSTSGEDEENVFQSQLATCGSGPNPLLLSMGSVALSPAAVNSAGDNNVGVTTLSPDGGRPKSPFDWRKVKMSDDEEEEDLTTTLPGPTMRNAATSPDPSLVQRGDEDDEDNRICPMCNALFPKVVPQESFESHVVSHFEVENGFEVIV
ncbi:uncharacterized protein LOC143033262 isoform X2 [Oratosquilla oratoria]|uniref:uncharacterized protein LOC143033262 isoform X2 n=1 Tax=Oratosquilla oratoria TaxID=337810 RepID=UPI003F7737D4